MALGTHSFEHYFGEYQYQFQFFYWQWHIPFNTLYAYLFMYFTQIVDQDFGDKTTQLIGGLNW
jgi:hypothetical protein